MNPSIPPGSATAGESTTTVCAHFLKTATAALYRLASFPGLLRRGYLRTKRFSLYCQIFPMLTHFSYSRYMFSFPIICNSWFALARPQRLAQIVRRRRAPATNAYARALRANVKPARCKFKGRELPVKHSRCLASMASKEACSSAPVLQAIG